MNATTWTFLPCHRCARPARVWVVIGNPPIYCDKCADERNREAFMRERREAEAAAR